MLTEEGQLKQEISHIFESGANQERVFNMVKEFLYRRPIITNSNEISKMEYFAAKALPLVHEIAETMYGNRSTWTHTDYAIEAYRVANAMIKEGEKWK